MSHSHKITKCDLCNKVLMQCRCMEKDKEVSYMTCAECLADHSLKNSNFGKLQTELAQLKYLEQLVTHTNKQVLPGEIDSVDALVNHIRSMETELAQLREKCADFSQILETVKTNLPFIAHGKEKLNHAFYKKCIGSEDESRELFEAADAIEKAISCIYFD